MASQPDQAAGTGGQPQELPAPAGDRVPDLEYRLRPGDQPLPAPNDGPSLHDLAIEDIRRCVAASAEKGSAIALMLERKRIGYERYGSYLQSGNGRDAKRDLREELADAAVYALQVIEEDNPPEGIDDVYEDILNLLCRVAGMEDGEAS